MAVTIKNPVTIVKQSGGGSYDPTNPQQVYEHTRPSDWLKMPEIGANEDNVFYFLLMVSKDRTNDVVFDLQTNGATNITATWEFGTTDSAGTFTPISALTKSATGMSNHYPGQTIPISAFGNATSGGMKQVICKITSPGTVTGIVASADEALSSRKLIVDFRGKGTGLKSIGFAGRQKASSESMKLRYFDLRGTNSIDSTYGENQFYGCYSLMAVLNLDTTGWTSFKSMFYQCEALSAIPQLNTSSGTNFSQMFRDCRSLTTIPQLDLSSGTDFSLMFQDCHNLTSVPQLDTSSGTSFSSMFQTCRSLASIPQLDTSSGNNFQTMFSACSSLTGADLTGYDFSATTMASAMSAFLTSTASDLNVELGDKWPASGLPAPSTVFSFQYSSSQTDKTALRIKISKTDAMLPLATNATTIFSASMYVYVYVPDALLATYQADTYWATLGSRLKGFSELPS